MELGLLYYNARYYLPGIARFISADTLVPNPTNPQNWNRYSYTNNNPVRFTDPTGHCVIEDDIGGQCTPMPPSSSSSPQTAASTSSAAPMPAISTDPMVTFNAGCDTCTAFTTEEITTIQESATLTGTRWAETLNALHGWSLTPEQAFVLVYGGSVNFLKTGTQCANRCWGETFLRNGDHVIEVYTDANIAGDPNWAIHELGHAFVNTGRGTPILTLSIFQSFEANFPNRPLTDDPHYWDNSPWGFAGGFGTWQRSDKGRASEEFADMYLGWVRNQWAVRGVVNGKPVWTEAGQMRADFMNTYMAEWAP
jgi:RHS repeat-associated protein